MRKCVIALLGVACLLAFGGIARAAAHMTFTHWFDPGGAAWGHGQRNYIFADGEITTSSPADFNAALARYQAQPGWIVVLNSPGGNLSAGIKLGREIRAHGLWTEVGSYAPTAMIAPPTLSREALLYLRQPASPPFPGYCYSSCTIAFLGGVVRSIGLESDYGVHRFYSEGSAVGRTSDIELIMGDIVQYLSDMGINPDFITQMVRKGRSDVTHLTFDQLAKLRVITPRWTTNWSLDQGDTGIYLLGRAQRPDGTDDEVIVSCGSKGDLKAGHAVILGLYVDPGGRIADPAAFAAGVTDYIVPPFEVTKTNPSVLTPAFLSPHHRVGAVFGVTEREFGELLFSNYLGFSFHNPTGPVKYLSGTIDLERQRLDRFARHCLPPSNTDFTLDNQGLDAVVAVSTRVSGPGPFGPNQLSQPVSPRQGAKIEMPHYRGCSFDVRATFADKEEVTYLYYNLCHWDNIVAFSPSRPRSPMSKTEIVLNRGNTPITLLNISPIANKNWGANLVTPAGASIAPGGRENVPLAIGSSCQFDIRVGYAGGRSEERGNENLCARGTLEFAAVP
jgi:hypothetical protein